MASKIKVDQLETLSGSGNITLNNPLSGSGASLTNLPAANLTGTLPALDGSNLTNLPVTDLTSVRQDLAMLAIYHSVSENKAAYNLPSSFIDTFQDDSGLATQTNVDRNATGEYVSSVQVTDGDDSYTKMLLHFDDTALANTASGATVNPATTGSGCSRSSTESKFGGYSMRNTGTSGLFFTYDGAWMAWGSQNWTIDFWFRLDNVATNQQTFFAGETDGQYVGIRLATTTITYPNSYNGSWGDELGTKNNYVNNTWYHVALVYNGSTIKSYVDGTLDATTSASGSAITGSRLSIFGDWGGGNTWYPTGYMDEFRISMGITRWTGNFTPYTAAYGSSVVNATGTLISDTQTASASTTSMSGCILYKDNAGTATLGTHLKIYLSANGGTNWTEVPSYGAVTPLFSTGVKMVRLPKTTVTAGTAPVMKAVWASQSVSLDTQLHGWAMNY